jgi:hypothetical protein
MNNKVPENFKNIVFDMIDDFSTTFPEYSGLLNKWNRANFADGELTVIDELFEYCLGVYPTHFQYTVPKRRYVRRRNRIRIFYQI